MTNLSYDCANRGYLIGICLLFAPLVAFADEAEEVKSPRPLEEKVHRVTLEEYEETLKYWGEQFPKFLTVERSGVSSQGLRIYTLKITDQDVPYDDKQVCLITSLHGGPEKARTFRPTMNQ